jgi:hypothetical protein
MSDGPRRVAGARKRNMQDNMLSRRALSRALLARQLLLHMANLPVLGTRAPGRHAVPGPCPAVRLAVD